MTPRLDTRESATASSPRGAPQLKLLDPAQTPMMRQYFEIKARYPGAILFYRIGDFYEMFHEDAVEASRILDLTLTSRNKNDPNPIPLCGVPHHACEGYLAKLVESGRKVVICDQVEDPRFAKGLVKREVTRVVTPGTVIEPQSLEANRASVLMAVSRAGDGFACAACDITTGRLEYFSVASAEALNDELARLEAREALHPETERESFASILKGREGLYACAVSDLFYDRDHARDLILKQYGVSVPEAAGIPADAPEISPIGALLAYLNDGRLLAPGILQPPVARRDGEAMGLDETTLAHLEILAPLARGTRGTSLVRRLDACLTPMGSRLLAEWLRAPLMRVDAIDARLEAVAELHDDRGLAERMALGLKGIGDLERLSNRCVLERATPRDIVALGLSLHRLGEFRRLPAARSALLQSLAERLHDFSELTADIVRTVRDDPPATTRDGGVIRDGVDGELDELRRVVRGGKEFILEIERRERSATGIPSLKLRYNQVFGYCIEVTHAHLSKVPQNYVRKQTLSTAERYVTDELKTLEAKILGAGERIRLIEDRIFKELCGRIASRAGEIKASAAALAAFDVLLSFAATARTRGYCRPVVTTEAVLELTAARHPVLETLAGAEAFVPNDVRLEPSATELIITGPNMAGKSTLMRQTALIAIMAQAGSFVPCDSARIGVCDRVFTRVGAHDRLQKGLSTFMVEMVETARILREATPRSLVLLDEIGRGTSTFDGLSIAWAVAEDLHDRVRSRTLFATHYHELCDLAEKKPGIRNVHMAVKEFEGRVIFLRKLMSGGTNRSYGVTVAGMAGLPPPVIRRAREVLKLLEVKDLGFKSEVAGEKQPSLFDRPRSGILDELAVELKAVFPETLTPVEALTVLDRLCRRAKDMA